MILVCTKKNDRSAGEPDLAELCRRREEDHLPADLRLHQVGRFYTKTLKGNLMVRKLLLWKTNKECEGGNFPAYVAYFTDFSPGRATPIDRDIRVSNSREQIEQLFAANES